MDHALCDICVIGGGPAGALIAYRLATLGHDVCLVERKTFPRAHVGEALSAGIRPLLESVGLDSLVARTGFRAPGATLLCWADPEPRTVPAKAKGDGLLVERGTFDTLLLHAARLAGVRILQPARARLARAPGGWQVEIEAADGVTSVYARLLVDAAGRRGCLPSRATAVAPSTLAVWAHLKDTSDSAEIRVEAHPEGWCWAAPIAAQQISVLLFCDPSTVRQRETGSLESFLRARLSTTRLLAPFAHAPVVGSVSAREATCIAVDEPAGRDFLKIGEASYTLDPLSSTGVEKALQSALVGAFAAHTMLRYPERIELCRRFMCERQRETVATHTRWAAQCYTEVERFAERPFWQVRRGGVATNPEGEPATLTPPLDPAIRVRLAHDVEFTDEPCLVGDVIAARRALRCRALGRPLVFLDGQEIVPLLTTYIPGSTWAEVRGEWSRRMTPERAERIGRWLCARGVWCTGDKVASEVRHLVP